MEVRVLSGALESPANAGFSFGDYFAGERAFYYFWAGLIVFLPPIAVGLAIFGRGTARAAGVVLLVVTVIVYAVPVSPILKAWVRRREARGRDGDR